MNGGFHYRDVRQALRKQPQVNGFTLARYGFSPYAACAHGCAYCDGRAEKYYIEGDFARDIVVRRNLPEVLAKELSKVREPGIISIGSGVSDPYQQAEASEGILRRCLPSLAASPCPVVLLTKSALLLRDLDLWKEVNRHSGFVLMVSLTFLDDSLRRTFEPGASSVEERLSLLATCKAAGIPVGVLAMPLLPGISDTGENINALFARLREIGVAFIVPGGLTLRPGRQKEHFMTVLSSRFPGLVAEYEAIYRENRSSGNSTWAYRAGLYDRLKRAFAAVRIPSEAPHSLYRDRMPLYDEVHILLQHMLSIYERKGVPTAPLEKSLSLYAAWLEKEKALFSRKRSMDYREIEEKLRSLARSGELSTILANPKLGVFLGEVILRRRTFDYLDLALRD